MAQNNNIKIGKMGENIASEYLIKNKYLILKRNHKERHDEIDIIAKSKEEILVFIEVKTLKTEFINSSKRLIPEDNLTFDKLRKIKRACQLFCGKNPGLVHPTLGWRLDLVAVSINRRGAILGINHYENI